jgi:hypothetical protein
MHEVEVIPLKRRMDLPKFQIKRNREQIDEEFKEKANGILRRENVDGGSAEWHIEGIREWRIGISKSRYVQ